MRLGGALQTLQPVLEVAGAVLAGGTLGLGVGGLSAGGLLVPVHTGEGFLEPLRIAHQLSDALAEAGKLLRGLVQVLLQRGADQLFLVVVLLQPLEQLLGVEDLLLERVVAGEQLVVAGLGGGHGLGELGDLPLLLERT